MNQNDKWKSAWNACKYLNRQLESLYAKYLYRFPSTKTKLQPFAIELQGIVEDTLSIAKVPRVKNHEMKHEEPQKKKEEDETKESQNG